MQLKYKVTLCFLFHVNSFCGCLTTMKMPHRRPTNKKIHSLHIAHLFLLCLHIFISIYLLNLKQFVFCSSNIISKQPTAVDFIVLLLWAYIRLFLMAFYLLSFLFVHIRLYLYLYLYIYIYILITTSIRFSSYIIYDVIYYGVFQHLDFNFNN